MRHTLFLSLCLSSLVLTGCSSLTHDDSPAADAAPTAETSDTVTAEEEESAEPPERPFEPNILYGLLAAEMAAERGRFDITLVNYVEAAKQTRDVGVIRRAMRFAQGLGADNAQYQLSQIWLDVAPRDVEALRIAAVQAIKHNDVEEALLYLDKIYAQDERAAFDNLGTYAATLPPDEQETLIETFRQLRAHYPKHHEIDFNLAILQYTAGRPDEAIATLEPILDQEPEYQPAIALYSTMLFESGEKDEALMYLRSQTRRYPESLKLGTLYARMLVDAGEIQAAQDEFQRLLTLFPDNPGLQLSYALVALENNEPKNARKALETVLASGTHTNEAHFYLGRLAESEGDRAAALAQYQQVGGGAQFYAALTRAGELMAEAGRLEPALERLERLRGSLPNQAARLWLVEINLLTGIGRTEQALAAADEAIAAYPEDVGLRYARAMINDKLGNLAAAEADLRWIIEREPENAVALNALGYTLTIQTSRYDEALALIERAHELAPDNAAILDSLGWVHFKRGDTAKALDYLTQAYEDFPDPEVAAHLGEVLWHMDRRDDARRIWKHALEKSADDATLLETLERLDVNLEES